MSILIVSSAYQNYTEMNGSHWSLGPSALLTLPAQHRISFLLYSFSMLLFGIILLIPTSLILRICPILLPWVILIISVLCCVFNLMILSTVLLFLKINYFFQNCKKFELNGLVFLSTLMHLWPRRLLLIRTGRLFIVSIFILLVI